jgi:BlaI family transcriptional regulator, penicillinase repressor
MVRTPHNVTEAELTVLQALWEYGSATIRQLRDRLYPDGGASDFATVQKLLERLEGKGCVQRDRSGAAQVFRAIIDRDELMGRWLRVVAEKLCNGSFTPLLTYLVRDKGLNAEERRALRQLVEELDQQNKSKKDRS